MTKAKKRTIHRCKNGAVNREITKPGFLGFSGLRYHPTKGFRRERGYDPQGAFKLEAAKAADRLLQTVRA